MPDAVETMAYHGETPWHGLGNKLKARASVETMKVESGLDWDVGLAPVQFEAYRRGLIDAKGYFVLYRKKDGRVYDIVGSVYKPIQNEQVLAFFKEYVEAGDMHLETAGSLNDGRQVWALARMDKHFTLPGKDRVEGYVLLMNPHQYGKAMVVKFTSVRVVCWNTLTAALHDGATSIKLWHNVEFTAEVQQEAKRRLGIAKEKLEIMEAAADRLVRLEMTPDEALDVIVHVLKDDPKKPGRVAKRMVELFSGAGLGATLPSAIGTGWGVLNAVTQYTDWEYGRTANRRLTRSWFGGGEVVKRKALTELLARAPK